MRNKTKITTSLLTIT